MVACQSSLDITDQKIGFGFLQASSLRLPYKPLSGSIAARGVEDQVAINSRIVSPK